MSRFSGMKICGIDTSTVIRWNGWITTLENLLEAGWEVEDRPRFHKYARHSQLRKTGSYVYLRNPRHAMLCRLTVEVDEGDYHAPWEADFMITAKQFRHRDKTQRSVADLTDTGFTPDDIPALLNVISELQKQYPKPKTTVLPSAEIIKLLHAA